MQSIENAIKDLQEVATQYKDDINALIEELETQLSFEKNKDLTGEWTKEYTEGYCAGSEAIINRLKEIITF